jgi:hypothetical protein
MSRAALARVEHEFTWSTVAERTANLYNAVVPERRAARRPVPPLALPIVLASDRQAQESVRA